MNNLTTKMSQTSQKFCPSVTFSFNEFLNLLWDHLSPLSITSRYHSNDFFFVRFKVPVPSSFLST